MFFYRFNMLENYIQDNFISNIDIEKEKISKIIDSYSNKKSTLYNITNKLVLINNNLEQDMLDKFYQTTTLIKYSFEDLDSIIISATTSKDLLIDIETFFKNNSKKNLELIKANLVEYNKKQDELFHKIMEFEEKFTSILDSASIFSSLPPSNESTNIFNPLTNVINDNNVLIVSEKEQKAYLPYTYAEIVKIYKNHADIYTSIQDVINKLYVLDLNKFKNSSISRFRECFNLMKNKEHSSIIKALDLALELMFKFNLNPIVIAACKNLDELDIYLDCLDKEELDDFKCFEIKFEVAPLATQKEKLEF